MAIYNPNTAKLHVRTYTVKRGDEIVLETTDSATYEKFIAGYKEVPPYGNGRLKTLVEYDQSKDKLYAISSGNYASMLTYTHEFYK